MARVVFMGSSEFSLPSLLALRMHFNVVGVVTQPDRPAGRGRKLKQNPVAAHALNADLPLIQPQSVNHEDTLEQLREWNTELIVVVAFGQILKPALLQLPKHGCVNVHASLLPRWRGASPIASAILEGDHDTGVTIMRMDAGMDTGPIILQRHAVIDVDDTSQVLEKRLAELGAQCLMEALPKYIEGELEPFPQPDHGVTYAPLLKKSAAKLDPAESVVHLDRAIRAYYPWPGAHFIWNGKRIKIIEAIPIPERIGDEPPGTVLTGEPPITIAVGEGALWITRLQMEGKREMDASEFIRGNSGILTSKLE